MLGSGREVFDTDNYAEGEEEAEKGRRRLPAPF